MKDYAYYRLPDADSYHIVRGRAQYLSELPDLQTLTAFVMTPFHTGGACPVIVIPCDNISTRALPKQLRKVACEWSERGNRSVYRHDFHQLHTMLADGKLEKVVLSRRSDCKIGKWMGSPLQVFQKACRMYPHQMIALVFTEDYGYWLMATPELLLRQAGDKWMTMALAGTMAEGKEGGWSNKNRREQQVVEDYVSATLAPFADDVEKAGPYTTQAARLFHLRTDFTFTLRTGENINDVIAALHPTPAVCGLPKNAALESLAKYESFDRRYYSGFCGPWNICGDQALFVSLRCMEISDGKNFSLYAGGGLLKESVERYEWQETEAKMQTMRNILNKPVGSRWK